MDDKAIRLLLAHGAGVDTGDKVHALFVIRTVDYRHDVFFF